MRKSRRQIINRIAEALGVALLALGAAVFFAVYRPLGNMLAQVAHDHDALRQTVRDQQVRLDLLKKYEAAMPAAGKGLDDFAANRTPARREAYSTAAHLLHKLADASGVKISAVAYRLDSAHSDPLERLGIQATVVGTYAGLVKFSHALETTNEFILIREFNLSPGEQNTLSLRLGADLYLTP